MLMSPLLQATLQPNPTRKIFRVSVTALLLLLSSFSSRQDYRQNFEALVDFIHTNAGLDFDHKLHGDS